LIMAAFRVRGTNVKETGMKKRALIEVPISGSNHPVCEELPVCSPLSLTFAKMIALFMMLVCTLAFAVPVYATTYNVNTSTDSTSPCAGTCSLRGAIIQANAASGTHTINLPAGTYNLNLTPGELQVGNIAGQNITITGAGSGTTTIHQTIGSYRVFNLDPSMLGNIAVSISGITISGGVGDIYGGGGILGGWTDDSLTVSNCVITGNSTTSGNNGGGISWGGGGSLTIQNSTISNNTATQAVGGGVAFNNGAGNPGNLTITSTTFTGNTASSGAGAGQGGGLFISLDTASTASINSSTFSTNTAQSDAADPGRGGGIYHASGAVTISGTTFTGNSATTASGNSEGGAIYSNSGNLSVNNGTISGNTASGAGGILRLDSVQANAENNWWGCNAGPGTTGCNTVSGNVDYSPWTYYRPNLAIAVTHTGNFTQGQIGASYTIIVSNPGSWPTDGYTLISVTDALPTGFTVTAMIGTGWTCTFSTATCTRSDILATSSSYPPITLTVNVPLNAPASVTNSATVTDLNDETNANNTADDPTTVIALLKASITKTFGAASVPLNGGTSLSFTITNANPAFTISGAAFTDNLPAGLIVATPNGLTGSCGGGTITATQGTGVVSLSGATLAAGGACTFAVNVTGTTAGVKNNSVTVSSTGLGTGNTSNANVTVMAPPTIVKSFGAASVPLSGSTNLSFTITNPNGSSLTGIGFSDTFPEGLVISTPNGLTGSCGGGNITATSGASSVSLSGATLASSGSCTFAVNVTGTSAGTKNNTTGNVASTGGGTGGTASASLAVNLVLTVNKLGSGTVTAIPSGNSVDTLTWVGNTGTANYSINTLVNLAATAGTGYTFYGWGGDLISNVTPVSITMDSAKTLTATFDDFTGPPCVNPPFSIGGVMYNYPTIGAVYNGMTTGATLKIRALDFNEGPLNLDQTKSVTLSGGYSCDFSLITGSTTVHGTLTISGGTVTIENLIIK
jgi:uncharacterized repeat protein (TIGR02543 family)